ncbi:MAG: DUF1573 domain-containing protein [Verrucomicrobiae bacterium]|nr:DUF1573 domain-containing protein [Verrucomicrobiae bacterium]MDW8343361.1 DUF1573 domain-containing protein [Verrucomicrobiae bacterium]
MKRLFWIGSFVVVNGLAFAGPQLQFDRTVYDFGRTANVSSVVGTFTFRNAGDAELRIARPAPACGCTVAGVKPEVLQPGETGELVFTLHLGNMRGIVQKTIAVPSNDPQNPTQQLTIRAEVVRIYEVNPQTIGAGDLLEGTNAQFTVHVRRVDGQPLQIERVVTTSPVVNAALTSTGSGDPTEAIITVTVDGSHSPRRFSERVQLFAPNESSPFTEITVVGRIVGDLLVLPERLSWGIGNFERLPASRVESLLTRTITVTVAKPNQSVEVSAPEADLPGMDLQLTALEPGKRYMLVARLPEIPKESAQGAIRLHTTSAKQPIVEIPYQITVVGK